MEDLIEIEGSIRDGLCNDHRNESVLYFSPLSSSYLKIMDQIFFGKLNTVLCAPFVGKYVIVSSRILHALTVMSGWICLSKILEKN